MFLNLSRPISTWICWIVLEQYTGSPPAPGCFFCCRVSPLSSLWTKWGRRDIFPEGINIGARLLFKDSFCLSKCQHDVLDVSFWYMSKTVSLYPLILLTPIPTKVTLIYYYKLPKPPLRTRLCYIQYCYKLFLASLSSSIFKSNLNLAKIVCIVWRVCKDTKRKTGLFLTSFFMTINCIPVAFSDLELPVQL